MPILDLTPEEQKRLGEIKAEARKAVEGEATKVCAEWAEDNTERILKSEGKTPTSHPEEAAKIRETYIKARKDGDLYGPFELEAEDGSLVTVYQIHANPAKYHGRRFCDPFERGYGNDKRIAYLNTRSARGLHLFSHAHGGYRCSLRGEMLEHRLVPGERPAAVAAGLKALGQAGNYFVLNGDLVRVTEGGEIVHISLQRLQLELDRLVRWLRLGKKAEAGFVPCDCPRAVAEGVLASGGSWGLPILRNVGTAPTMDPLTGRIIEQDGYDPDTGILMVVDANEIWRGVPGHPTLALVQEALARLWTPFESFPFCGALDRSVFLAALLSAVIRVLLPTCPGFAFVASTPGSGKTLLALCLSIIAGCGEASVMVGVKDDDEMRKRLLAAGRRGSPALVLDNINGAFGSDALNAWMTCEWLIERILGQSQDARVRTVGLVLLTGNNLRIKGDLCRRILVSRIEPGVADPWRRAFKIDPAAYCRKHRLEMVADALLVLRYYMGRPTLLADRTASVEIWSDTVRRAVAGIGADKIMDVVDPVAGVEANYTDDPDTLKVQAVFTAWESVFGDKAVTVQDIASAAADSSGLEKWSPESDSASDDAQGDLKAAVFEIAGEGRAVNTRRLGYWLANHAGRIVDGRRLKKGPVRRGYGTWALEAS